LLGAEQADLAMTGGEYTDKVPAGAYRAWYAPNLTASENGLGLWPHTDVAAYLKTGRNAFVETFGPMNEVTMNSTRYLRADDIDAMATYLKSQPANDRPAGPEPENEVLGMGRTLYNLHCGTCHLPTGLGDPEVAPRLGAGSLVVRAANPASLINVILDGPEPPQPPLPPKWRNPMEDFRYLLDDEEIAALATYVRNSWGNRGGQVSPEQVAEQR
jgi:mono/diheme cytochrome c family protein